METITNLVSRFLAAILVCVTAAGFALAMTACTTSTSEVTDETVAEALDQATSAAAGSDDSEEATNEGAVPTVTVELTGRTSGSLYVYNLWLTTEKTVRILDENGDVIAEETSTDGINLSASDLQGTYTIESDDLTDFSIQAYATDDEECSIAVNGQIVDSQIAEYASCSYTMTVGG